MYVCNKEVHAGLLTMCPGKKRDQNVFCNIFYKTGTIPMKLDGHLLNKFAKKSLNVFRLT